MPTRKTKKSHEKTAKKVAARAAALARDYIPNNRTKYLVPGAALGTGLAATAMGFVMKEPLSDLVRSATHGAVDAGLGNLLVQIGLRKKSSSLASWIGAAVVGVAAASAVALWLSPRAKAPLARTLASIANGVAHGQATEVADGIRDDASRKPFSQAS